MDGWFLCGRGGRRRRRRSWSSCDSIANVFLRLKEEEEFLDGGGGRGLGLFEVDCFVSILFTFLLSFE